MFPVIAICPSICAIPAIIDDRDELVTLIQAISELSRQIRMSKDIVFFGLDDIAGVLAFAEQFPVTDGIRKLLKESGLEGVYSIKDIRVAVNTLIDRPRPISLLSTTSFVVPIVIAIRPKCGTESGPLFEGFALLLAHLAIAFQRNPPLRELVSVASAMPVSREMIEFEARLEMINPPVKIAGGYREELDVNIQIASNMNVDNFLQSINPQVVWLTSSGEDELRSAVRLFAERLVKDADGDPKTCQAFIFGEHFVESLMKWDGLGDKAYSNGVLETCARIVADMPKNEIKQMRSRSATGKERVIPNP
jgi:hypothetical protein